MSKIIDVWQNNKRKMQKKTYRQTLKTVRQTGGLTLSVKLIKIILEKKKRGKTNDKGVLLC